MIYYTKSLCKFFSCSDESWAKEHNVAPSTTPFHDYLISIYWAAATTTTVGYGDVSAHTPLVRNHAVCEKEYYNIL